MNRMAHRRVKFGNWVRSQSVDEDVTQAGKLIGLHFHYDRIEWTPNTRLAHKVMAYAQQQGESADRQPAHHRCTTAESLAGILRKGHADE